MFTGIVQCQAEVVVIDRSHQTARLQLGNLPPEALADLNIGASVAINGCCLTVTAFGNDQVAFDLIDETLSRTNLGELSPGARVNLERALKLGDELGGHLVSGHIHCTGRCLTRTEQGENLALQLAVPNDWQRYLLAKGFIAVNGASLTLGEVEGGYFWLHLIPETRRLTNLDLLAEGQVANVEFDQQTVTLMQTVEHLLAERGLVSQSST